MTPTSVIHTERLDLVPMTPRFIEALLAGDRPAAEGLVDFPLPAGWPDGRTMGTLRYRREQLRRDPSLLPWLLRALVRRSDQVMVGYINFHGGPRPDRSNELGYTVFEANRRQGYASEAVEALIEWAREEHGVGRIVLAISPTNEPSLALARKLGFIEFGSQEDEVDGLELLFQRAVDTSERQRVP